MIFPVGWVWLAGFAVGFVLLALAWAYRKHYSALSSSHSPGSIEKTEKRGGYFYFLLLAYSLTLASVLLLFEFVKVYLRFHHPLFVCVVGSWSVVLMAAVWVLYKRSSSRGALFEPRNTRSSLSRERSAEIGDGDESVGTIEESPLWLCGSALLNTVGWMGVLCGVFLLSPVFVGVVLILAAVGLFAVGVELLIHWRQWDIVSEVGCGPRVYK